MGDARWTADFHPRRGAVPFATGGAVVAIRVNGRFPPGTAPWVFMDGAPLFCLPVGTVWRAKQDGGESECAAPRCLWQVRVVPDREDLDGRWAVRFLVVPSGHQIA